MAEVVQTIGVSMLVFGASVFIRYDLLERALRRPVKSKDDVEANS